MMMLILPNYLLNPRLKKIKRITPATAREIADEFTASLTATLLKIVQSNSFPLVVACYNKNKRRWFKRAQMVPGWWYPNERLDRATFASDMLVNGTEEQTWPRKIGADAWFGFRNCDRFEVQEQSFMLNSEDILCVLTIPEDGLG
jgi:hypothetical protein